MNVTGLVLTIGEETMPRAIESLKKQTHPLDDVVVVENVSPFSSAMNAGIKRIRTPFFVQCDSDMIPDPDCIETMLGFVSEDIGVVMAYLLDDLLGKIQAIKLFRTECFDRVSFPNRISPDTECINRMNRLGWKYLFARRSGDIPVNGHPPEILGEHKPDYSPAYTFRKFELLGARMRYRGVYREFDTCFQKLRVSQHPAAQIALIALCHGLFQDGVEDGLRYRSDVHNFDVLQQYMDSHNNENAHFSAVAGQPGSQSA